MNKVFASAAEAVKDIADGSVIMTTTAGTITNSTTLPSGDAFTIKLPYAALTFTWTPGGNCAPAP